MTDLQLSSLFINQLLMMGLPAIDDSLMRLLTAMETFPKSAILGSAVSFAKMLGLLLALCMGSYECWMMMLGRRGMDVMKLARIIGLSLCITYSSYICESLKMPGKGLEEVTRQMAQSKNREVAALELKVAQKQDDYLKRLRQVQDSIETAKQVQEIGEDAHWWDKLIYNMENLGSTINNYAQRAAVAAETKVSEWINDVIRFVGELIFQMSYYGMLVAQRINLMEDIKAYDTLLRGTVNSWQQIGALGLQGIGSNCMYAMGMLVGAYVLRFVPEVASWLIPGGISSSAGTASGSMAQTLVFGGASYAMGAASTTVAAGAAAATGTASIIGAAQQSHSDGGSGFNQTARTIMAQTGLGASYSRGADSARSINNVGKSDSNYKPGGAESNN